LDFTVLSAVRAGLIARQKAVLEERREPVMTALRAERDREYRVLLDAQKEQRGELIDRQDRGLSSPRLLDRAHPSEAPEKESDEARIAAVLDRLGIRRGRTPAGPNERHHPHEKARSKKHKLVRGSSDFASFNPSRDIGSAFAGGLLAIFGSLGESMTGGHTRPDKPSQDVIDALDHFGIRRVRRRWTMNRNRPGA
jgi:hypothetical protein